VSGLRVGDKVQASCGENVVIGTVTALVPSWIALSLDCVNALVWLNEDWTVEKVVPPYTDPDLQVGMIVRNANRGVSSSCWVYIPENAKHVCCFRSLSSFTWANRSALPSRIERGYIGADGHFVPLDTA
jgi:hypothetical protein